MTLAAVLFDMDGLLVDTEPLWMRAEQALATRLGCTDWGPEDQRAILGAALPIAGEYLRQRTGSDLPGEQLGQMAVAGFLDLVRAEATIPLQPGAGELVAQVAAAGVPFALVSASERPIMDMLTAHMARAGVPAFPVTVAGDEVPQGKPHPTPYLRAAELLGADITRSVVLEDSINGVQSGWAAGATVVAVEAMVRHEPRERVIVRQSLVGLDLADLRALVAAG
jgi:HAD superfamily hydrolase (TIGR01509 family)